MNIPRLSSRRLILVASLLALALALTLTLWPQLARAPEAAPTAAGTIATPPPAPTSSVPSSTSAPTLTSVRITPTQEPRIEVGATTGQQTITFTLRGQMPSGATEALLWYDTAAGHAIRRIPLSAARTISASVTIIPTQEGLTLTEALGSAPSLDYWWALRDGRGAIVRRAGSLTLPPPMAALAQTKPITAPVRIAWVEQATPHFRLRAPPGTAATRDLGRLSAVAEASYAQAASVITTTHPVSISVYLLPRVFWQGGVAYGQGGPLEISYLDRNYAGIESWSYFVHEVTHALSADVLPRGTEVGGLLGEGVAVYATGGHYGLEPIDSWDATLAASQSYIPLCRLRYDFYGAQHEIAYEEGASFVGYLIRTYGLDTFRRIYAAQRPQRGDRKIDVEAFCAADDRRAVPPTGVRASVLERDWLAYLKTIHPTEEQRRSWELTVRFFNTMRRYQETLDKPARDLPPPPDTWDRATAAKYLNAATGHRAIVLETMLGAALPAIQNGDLAHATALLDAIETALAAPGASAGSLAHDYDAIAGVVEAQARALRLGASDALNRTLATPALAATLPFTTSDLLHDLRITLVRLDIRGDTAEGTIQIDGDSLGGKQIARALYQARFTRTPGGWLLAGWTPRTPEIEFPPGPSVIGATR